VGLTDRDYGRYSEGGRGGGARGAFRRMFVDGDSFFSWALPLFTFKGVRVRVHLLYIIYIIATLLTSIPEGKIGFAYQAMGMAALFVMVLLHEFGHIFACRWVRGNADDILMWPLGGLASCAPPHHWKAHFITTAGGPMVNVALIPIIGLALVLLGAPLGALVYNPFDSSGVIKLLGIEWGDGGIWGWRYVVWWVYHMNLALLLFNVLLPMFPMDGSRLWQAVLWPRMGYEKSMYLICNVGLVFAVLVGTFAIVTGQSVLLGVAIFGGMTSFNEKRRLEFSRGEFSGEEGVWAASAERQTRSEVRKYREAAKKQEREVRRQADVDRILAKIAQEGMGSLTRAEKAVLRDETERKRGA
jgi:stage IV sporulation protein FB